MALIVCVDCGKEVSSGAPSCPHCGSPKPMANKTKTLSWRNGIFRILVVASVCWTLFLLICFANSPTRGKYNYVTLTNEQKTEWDYVSIAMIPVGLALIWGGYWAVLWILQGFKKREAVSPDEAKSAEAAATPPVAPATPTARRSAGFDW